MIPQKLPKALRHLARVHGRQQRGGKETFIILKEKLQATPRTQEGSYAVSLQSNGVDAHPRLLKIEVEDELLTFPQIPGGPNGKVKQNNV